MTREEAIKELQIEWLGEYGRQREAKNVAIKALEQESTNNMLLTAYRNAYAGLKEDMKALNCGYPYGLDYLIKCINKRFSEVDK